MFYCVPLRIVGCNIVFFGSPLGSKRHWCQSMGHPYQLQGSPQVAMLFEEMVSNYPLYTNESGGIITTE